MTKLPHRHVLAPMAVSLLAGTLLSCTSSSSQTPQPSPTPSVAPSPTASPSTTVSFRNQVQPIFTANCSVSGCHSGSAPSGGMNLAVGQALASIKDRQSQGYGTLLRVKSGDSATSVLFAKISSDSPTIGGRSVLGDGRMPLGRPPLSSADIATIQTWINEGAQDN